MFTSYVYKTFDDEESVGALMLNQFGRFFQNTAKYYYNRGDAEIEEQEKEQEQEQEDEIQNELSEPDAEFSEAESKTESETDQSWTPVESEEDFDVKSDTTYDTIVTSIIRQFKDRAKVGLQKYGTDLDRNDLTFNEWIQHAQEEHMDSILYLEKVKQSFPDVPDFTLSSKVKNDLNDLSIFLFGVCLAMSMATNLLLIANYGK